MNSSDDNEPSAPPRVEPASRARNTKPRSRASLRVLKWEGSDAELLQRLEAEPQAGAALFYERFSREVNGLVWRLLGADRDHDDLVQQVFYKLLTNVGRVREGERLRGWVQSVTVNAVYSELRKRSVRRLFIVSQSHAPPRFVDATGNAESRDLLRRLYTELDKMGAAERVVFSLRYIEEKSLAEVAELCDCSLATVKRRLQRAKKHFAAFCARYPELAERLSAARREQEELEA